MNERPLSFGPRNGLFGIHTPPAVHREGAPTAILLNAGLLHRVGPNRLYVDMARRLAGLGFPAFRFDTSGVGDSELLDTGMLDIERSQHDVLAAMDALGDERFVLIGLCTGAFNAFRVALRDDRVAGCVLLDGYAYPTARSRIRHYRSRVFELDRWLGWFARRLGLGGRTAEVPGDDLVVFENEVVTRERFEDELGRLLARQVEMLLVYTGLGPLAFNYERQMHDAFPDLDLDRTATVRYYPNADHTFTLPGNRLALLEDIDNWMQDTFPVAAPTAPSR